MRQNYELNKRRIQTFKLTADVKDDSGKIHHFFEGYEYVEIGGLKWATCNIGAEKETDGGLYFAWGETVGYNDGKEKGFTWDDYKFVDNGNILKYNHADGLTTLEVCDDAASKNMGESWRIPTKAEFDALLCATTKEWATVNGVNGMLFTDKTERSKKLFFPAVGYCSRGSVDNVGSYGNYWSSSLYTFSVISSWYFGFGSGDFRMCYDYRRYGFQVRAVFGQK